MAEGVCRRCGEQREDLGIDSDGRRILVPCRCMLEFAEAMRVHPRLFLPQSSASLTTTKDVHHIGVG